MDTWRNRRMVGRFWKYGAWGLAVYLVIVYSYFAYRHIFSVTRLGMGAPVEELISPTTVVAATRFTRGTGAFSLLNMRKTIQNKTTQDKNTVQIGNTSQDKKTIQKEKTSLHTKTIQKEKTSQDAKTIQKEKTSQDEKTIQNEKTSQHKKTIQKEKTSQDAKTIQKEKTSQDEKTIQKEKTSQDEKTIQKEKTSQDEKTIQKEKTSQHKKTIEKETLQEKKTVQDEKTRDKMATQNKTKTATSGDTAGISTQGRAPPTSSTHILTSTMKQNRKELVFLTPVFHGRLGNQLFEYAASFAIAKMKNMSLFIPKGNVINKLFHVDKTVVTFQNGCKTWRRVVVECCDYSSDLIKKINKNECQAIGHFLQSWKYFKPVEASIRQQLTFKTNIALAANRKLLSVTQELRRRRSGWPTDQGADRDWTSTHVGIPTTPIGGATNSSLLHPGNANDTRKTQSIHVHEANADGVAANLTYIGMHVRRGDYMSSRSRYEGRLTPPAEYYIHAMRYFRAIFPNTLFVVAGDDGSWVNRNIGAPDVVVVQRDSEEVDLCVLSMCNHTILSVGSFGWWAGFLAGGTTVYYKHPYRNNTYMSRWYSRFHSDYVLPDWVPME